MGKFIEVTPILNDGLHIVLNTNLITQIRHDKEGRCSIAVRELYKSDYSVIGVEETYEEIKRLLSSDFLS